MRVNLHWQKTRAGAEPRGSSPEDVRCGRRSVPIPRPLPRAFAQLHQLVYPERGRGLVGEPRHNSPVRSLHGSVQAEIQAQLSLPPAASFLSTQPVFHRQVHIVFDHMVANGPSPPWQPYKYNKESKNITPLHLRLG